MLKELLFKFRLNRFCNKKAEADKQKTIDEKNLETYWQIHEQVVLKTIKTLTPEFRAIMKTACAEAMLETVRDLREIDIKNANLTDKKLVDTITKLPN